MTSRPADETSPATRAIAQRLTEAARILLAEQPVLTGEAGADAGLLVDLLVGELLTTPDPSHAWLALTAAAACYPTLDEVGEFVHRLRTRDRDSVTTWFVHTAATASQRRGSPLSELDVISDRVLVSVDYCARVDHHTGIQRVTRETVPRLAAAHDILPVAWTDRSWSMRTLEPIETDRVMHWNDQRHLDRPAHTAGTHRLIAPWRATVLLMEVVLPPMCPAMASVAELSGSRVAAIGYDTIPLISADLRPPMEPENFVAYLDLLMRADVIAGISDAATAEFAGAAAMRAAGSGRHPRTVSVPLPAEAPPGASVSGPARSSRLPLVVTVGSQEMHKNHLAVLAAAERVWEAGINFELQFVGRRGWGSAALADRVEVLQRRGHKVSLRAGLTDAELVAAYRDARFSIFTSIHEGFGLPIVESLSSGTPVLTTRYGSMAEIAAAGGCLTVDPRDDGEIAAAITRLLVDDALVADLVAQAERRPVASWDSYATRLWDAAMEGAR